MNTKVRTIVALLALALLIGLVAVLWQPAATGLAQLWSPLPTPTQTPFHDFEPTPPSENWPTLTPWPTATPWPTVTPGYTPWPTFTPEPTPTCPPLLLTPIPPGPPPDDLQFLYYVADTDHGPELRAIGMDGQGRRWSETASAIERFPGNLAGLHLSPDGRYVALEVIGDGYGEVDIIERSSGQIGCPLGDLIACTGGFGGWTPDNRFLFGPGDLLPEGVSPGATLVVDVETGQYQQLDLPREPQWGYSLVQDETISPDGSRLAYSTVEVQNREEITEIWVMRMDGSDRQRVYGARGWIDYLSWSPNGEQLLFGYQSGPTAFDPGELWLLNLNGNDARQLATDLPMPGGWWFQPAWSPDGRYVAFVQLDQPVAFDGTYVILARSNVYAIDIITGQITRLSSFEGREVGSLAWSPDSRFVAFVSTARLGPGAFEETLYSEIWVASTDGRRLYPVSGMATPYNTLAWFPSALFHEGR